MCAMPSPFALPCRFPKAPLIAALAGACAVAGCAKTPDPAATTTTGANGDAASGSVIQESVTHPLSDEPDQSIRETPLGGVASTAAQPVPVKVGAAPLVYLVDSTQVVQVIDETAGVILAELPVRGRTIVRVDERNGVIMGDDQVFAGPLPEGRRYGIYVVPDEENVSRAGRFMPRPTREIPTPRPPESRPAVEGPTPEDQPADEPAGPTEDR
jgi:hypothetical protein